MDRGLDNRAGLREGTRQRVIAAFEKLSRQVEGGAAAQRTGQACRGGSGRILIVISVPFRCRRERGMGFRRSPRIEFPRMRMEERVISDDQPETAFEHLKRHFDDSGLSAAIYNIAGADRGVARALEASRAGPETIFPGQELKSISRGLLEVGMIDYVIARDFSDELVRPVSCLPDSLEGVAAEPAPSRILARTKDNCGQCARSDRHLV